ADRPAAATLVCLHPLPTHGGMMDSHVIRKASYRLPALADLAVLRFNTRGTESGHGKSEGEFGAGETERHDVEAAIAFAAAWRRLLFRGRGGFCRGWASWVGRWPRGPPWGGARGGGGGARSCPPRRCAAPPMRTLTPGPRRVSR